MWHSSGERGDLTSDMPVGMLLMVILDHLGLGLGWGRGALEGRGRDLVRDAVIWGAANWSM